jgi:hypothetical protein
MVLSPDLRNIHLPDPLPLPLRLITQKLFEQNTFEQRFSPQDVALFFGPLIQVVLAKISVMGQVPEVSGYPQVRITCVSEHSFQAQMELAISRPKSAQIEAIATFGNQAHTQRLSLRTFQKLEINSGGLLGGIVKSFEKPVQNQLEKQLCNLEFLIVDLYRLLAHAEAEDEGILQVKALTFQDCHLYLSLVRQVA